MTAVVSFFAFTATVAAISWWITRKDRMDSSEAYFLAGRSLTAWVIAGSLMLTNLSTEHLIGLNADAFNHGFMKSAAMKYFADRLGPATLAP